MICPNCAAAGDLTAQPSPDLRETRSLAGDEHAKCPGGTWCDCQHSTPPIEVLAQRRTAMPRGGPARIVDTLSAGSD